MTAQITASLDLLTDSLTAKQRGWIRHVQRHQDSGLSLAAYARQEGLAVKTFYRMRLKLLAHAQAMTSIPSALFQPVAVVSAPASDACHLPGTKRKADQQNPISSLITLQFQLPGSIRCDIADISIAACAALLQQLTGNVSS